MAGWISKLFGRSAAAPPAALRATAAVAVAVAGVAPPQAAKPAAPAVAIGSAPATPSAPALFGVRRPLVAASGAVAGFEFSLPGPVQKRLAQRADIVTVAAYQAALMMAARPVLEASRRALLRVSAEVLSRPGWASEVRPVLHGYLPFPPPAPGLQLPGQGGPPFPGPPASFCAW